MTRTPDTYTGRQLRRLVVLADVRTYANARGLAPGSLIGYCPTCGPYTVDGSPRSACRCGRCWTTRMETL